MILITIFYRFIKKKEKKPTPMFIRKLQFKFKQMSKNRFPFFHISTVNYYFRKFRTIILKF